LATCEEAIDNEDNNCADHATNDASRISGPIPPDSLPKVSCNERAYDSKIAVRMKPLGSYLSPGIRNLAITPTINPMRMVQSIAIAPFLESGA
jgi:hypothetical protein